MNILSIFYKINFLMTIIEMIQDKNSEENLYYYFLNDSLKIM